MPPRPRSTSTATTRGQRTRRRAQQVALDLFTRQGYESTSLRQIADGLGMNKASLYYYFDSKDAILRSLLEERGHDADDLLTWLREQPKRPGLVEEAVLRWVGAFTADTLRAIRFMSANPLVVRSLADPSGARIGQSLTAVADELVALLPDAGPEERLLVRMAILSVQSAVQAAADQGAPDDVVLRTATRAARAVILEAGSVTGQGIP